MVMISGGKTQAFDALYQRYAARLMNYFLRMLNYERALSEDALQDIFLKIVQNPQQFDSTRSFKTWVFSMAHNTCKNYYRHRAVIDAHEHELGASPQSYDLAFHHLADKMDAARFRHHLSEALDRLSAEKRSVFILRFQEDRSLAEIAQIMNCPEGSVKSRLHYALRQLEEQLSEFKPIKD
jgi:RNA polymerase sigma-70 factor (ECF subfamily)